MNKNNKYSEFYVSVDIEAVGPIPGKYSMSSIGAFIAGTRKIDGGYESFDHNDSSNIFYRELKPLNSNYVTSAINVGLLKNFDYSIPDDDGSRKFAHLVRNGFDPISVMADFASFVNDAKSSLGGRPVFMAYPAGFDWTFVYWYFQNFDIVSPFGFSNVLDLKAVYSVKFDAPLTKSVKRNMPKSLFPSMPHTHRADEDAIEQGIFGMNLLSHS